MDLQLYRKSKMLQSVVLVLILGFLVAIMAIIIRYVSYLERFDRQLSDLHLKT